MKRDHKRSMQGLENWCRLCACEGYLEADLFNSEREKCNTISEDLDSLCNIKLECSVNLPTKICKNCYLNFKTIRCFIKNWVQAQELFKDLIHNQSFNNCKLTIVSAFKDENHEVEEEEEEFQNLEFLYENESEKSAQIEQDKNDFNLCSIKQERDSEIGSLSDHEESFFDSKMKNMDEIHNIDSKTQTIVLKNNNKYCDEIKPKLNNNYEGTLPKSFPCDICRKNCLSQSGLKRHKDKIHHNKKIVNVKITNFQCKICSQYYSNRGGLTIHMKIKHSIGRNKNKISAEFHCNICGKNFVNQTGLSCHLKFKHDIVIIKDLKYKCSFCGKKFEKKRHLEIHENAHLPLGERQQLPCPHCDKTFNSISGRWSHIHSVHDKRKTVVCEECGKEFATAQHLAKHKAVHKQERNIQCPHCPAKFKTKSGLTTHLQVHGDSYSCSICGSVLNTKNLLRRHMIVHTSGKNFKCNFCNKDFKRLEGLNYHLKKHICVNTFECSTCSQTFNLELSYRRHIKARHPLEYSKMFNDENNLTRTNSLSSQLKAINDAVKD